MSTPTANEDKQLMKEFYRSGATNFLAFKRARQQQTAKLVSPAAGAAASAIAAARAGDIQGNDTSIGNAASSYAAAPAPASPIVQHQHQTVVPASPAAPITRSEDMDDTPASPISNRSSRTPSPELGINKTAPAMPQQPQVVAKHPKAQQQSAAQPPHASQSDAALPANLSMTSATLGEAELFEQSGTDAAGRSTGRLDRMIAKRLQGEPTEAASPDYIAFLRHQQDLHKCHQKLEETVSQYKRDRQGCQANVAKVRRQANELLQALESGTNWNLTSKYTVQALIRDAKLKLQPRELYQHGDKPQYLDIIQQLGNLEKLQKDYAQRDAYQEFRTLLENAARRLERVQKEVAGSQLDTTVMARLPDTLFIQLDHVLGSKTIEEILRDNNAETENLQFKLEDTRVKLQAALLDGEMQAAEELSYDMAAYLEGILALVRDKITTTERTKKEALVFDKVRGQYQAKAQNEVEKLKNDKIQLKTRCENDLGKIFDLKGKVDKIEKDTVKKLAEDNKTSDAFLTKNAQQIEGAWAKIHLLEQELEDLERDRHQEIKRRVASKEKDEHRHMEFQRFCQVVEHHASLLDLTIRNCDTAVHCVSLLGEMVDTGFITLGSHLSVKDTQHSELLLETHKEHLEHFRGLYMSLGDLIMKKGQRIEQIDAAIQSCHVKQKLAEETFHQDAKKYSLAKKELLHERDNCEASLADLRRRADFALDKFRMSEQALQEAGVPFVHPVVEQKEQELETKAKLLQYRATAMSHADSLAIQSELAEINRQIAENKSRLQSVHSSMQATANSTLPALKLKASLAQTYQR